eukprot:TRINITY_DN6703_c1_g1_i1.p1 TRINITY_DN6703_c1_g1~~TRINITY_DN6703_c1_g1_i1.p1  ORF type:complete len:806 (-),score=156.31 TRINITY_DN6703_c1_g1_i1:73-2490(-)
MAAMSRRPAAGPFGPGSRISICTHGACTNQGAAALISDLEELAPHLRVQVARRGCLGMCGQGPNCLLEPPSGGGRQCVERRVDSFQKALAMLQKVATPSSSSSSSSPPAVLPPQLLHRAQLKSDALRLLQAVSFQPDSVLQSMQKACQLLSSAIQLEMHERSLPAAGSSSRLRDLMMLRGRALGRAALAMGNALEGRQHGEAALADFRAVIGSEPQFAPAYLELAKVCSFTGQLQQAVDFYRHALTLPGLGASEAEQVRRSLAKLDQRLASAPSPQEKGNRHSGDGSGRWKVARITGLSHDSCIYNLENLPPEESHPFPHHAWHVQVFLGSTMREYTPVSSAAAWEAGQLDLLVKTYTDGIVSKNFGTLRTFDEALEASLRTYSPVEDQACWITLSAPMLTLYLPALSEEASSSGEGTGDVEQLDIVAGGTGIAPALQLLREVMDPKGAFGPCCRATLLYSSRSSLDVLLLDELRAAEASAGGRVAVRHTLTDQPEGEDPWESVPSVHFAGRHGHFASYFQPFEPESGPLRPGCGEEAVFRGRLNSAMMEQALAGPGRGTRCVLCGPQGLLDAARAGLMALGHLPEAIVSLRASPITSKKGAGGWAGTGDRVQEQTCGQAETRLGSKIVLLRGDDSSGESESGIASSSSSSTGRRAVAVPPAIRVSAASPSIAGSAGAVLACNVKVPPSGSGATVMSSASLTSTPSWSTHDAPPPLAEEWARPPAPPPLSNKATGASTSATSVAPSWSTHVAPPLLDKAPKVAVGSGSKAAAALAAAPEAPWPAADSRGSFADRVLLANLSRGPC